MCEKKPHFQPEEFEECAPEKTYLPSSLNAT